MQAVLIISAHVIKQVVFLGVSKYLDQWHIFDWQKVPTRFFPCGVSIINLLSTTNQPWPTEMLGI